ncbi:MAG TPA: RNA polymerase sigma factor [Nocardioides sp.]|uniref:RNA polymerase sigma factor n=1 Tax=Nocardioides sp. TaxID=35761 RepID=UPI002F414C79
MTDEGALDETVRRMCAGDGEAFRVVYRAVQAPLLRYLEVLVGREDAEDVASETWGQAVRDLDRFSGDADGFRGWITTIGRHRALDLLRHRSRRIRADQDLTGVDVADPVDLEVRVAEVLTTEAALELIRRLPRDQAEAVMLRAVMGLDARSAGAVLGKRAGAVRSATQRGLRSLERTLDVRPESLLEVRDTFRRFGAEGVR